MLSEASRRGLPSVGPTTDPANVASQRVILACGGRPVERFREPAADGAAEDLRDRIALDAPGDDATVRPSPGS